MDILLVGDPLSQLKPKSDSSLVFAEQALMAGHNPYWAEDSAVALDGDSVWVSAARIPSVSRAEGAKAGNVDRYPLHHFKIVFVRKDPPFDESYLRLCWLLATEESRCLFLNKPSLLLRYHEKMLPFEGIRQGFLKPADVIPTLNASGKEAGRFLENLGTDEVVSKPFLGHGGEAVHRLRREEMLRFESHSPLFGPKNMLQPFQSEINKGDARVFFLAGKYLTHFFRVPPEGQFVSNLAQGGTAQLTPFTARQKSLVEKVGKFLARTGTFFAGADLIGNRLSEINITSPTGLRALEQLHGEKGKAFAEKIFSKALSVRSRH